MIAAFLPLPPKPGMWQQDALDRTLQMRIYDIEERRYENSRWWRNLNRFMIPLGIVVIVLVVSSRPRRVPDIPN